MSEMSLPTRARLLIAASAISGALALAWAASRIATPDLESIAALAVIGGTLLVSDRFPFLLYGRSYSEAVSFGDGLLAASIALLTSSEIIFLFAGTQLVAQIWRRRNVVKTIFNTAQFTLAATSAVLLSDLVGRDPGHVTSLLWPAIAAGTAAFVMVNGVLVGALLNILTGQSLTSVWREGTGSRLLVVAVGTTTGALGGMAAASNLWALALIPLAFFLLRRVLAGHFEAKRDRDRVFGLLDAAREIHSAMADGRVPATVEGVASRLLRGEARVMRHRASGLCAAITDHDSWLVVTGRDPGEPFDSADVQLLHTIAAIAAGAFTNADLYGEVHQQRRDMAAILGNLAEGVCAFDTDGRPTFWNAAARDLLGITAEEFDPDHPSAETLLAPVRRCLQSGMTLDASMTLVRSDGTPLPISFTCAPTREGDVIDGVVLAFRDDTERLDFEAQLSHHAFHDQLTGLANRRLFIDRLDQALRRAERHGGFTAVCFVDIDRFKLINDSLGHQAGDRLLTEIAKRLSGLVRDGDTVARFGGDEFTLLLEDLGDPSELHDVADRIVRAMEAPIEVLPGRTILATLSIGVAVSRPDASGDDLLHDADLAMYEAKAEGLGRWKQYVGGGGRSIGQLELEEDLRAAIGNGQIEVFFQPMVDAEGGIAADAEALVRWKHPRRGMIPPNDFIPLAEETGLVLPLGRLVLREACRQCKSWEDNLGVAIGVSVNLSPRQFQDGDLVNEVRSALEGAGLEPHRLCLEITESLAMRETEWTIQTLQRLKAIGVRVAIDDFGTGHSSLNYLKRFPIDVVKIDGSFVNDITTSVVDTAIITAVVTLAETLGIATIAECVEDVEQLEKLRELGCTLIQGYLFAKPMPSAELSRWLANAAQPGGIRIPKPRVAEAAIPAPTR
ncbi:MAG TPA: EAL domain-containing protein [Mycobacteriales bacterium]|nr:EAL domain-containing protein [Mycobacteriales bacterium]